MKIKQSIIIILMICSIYNNISYADADRNTYISLDALYSNTKMDPEFGGSVFSQKKVPGLNFSLGHMYTKHIGGEIGFELNKTSKKTTNLGGDQPLFGHYTNDSDLIYSVYSSKLKQKNIYFGIISKTNIYNKNNSIAILIGASYSTFKLTTNLLGEQFFDTFTNTQIFQSEYKTYRFNKSKFIPLMQLSFKHIYNNIYGIKFFCTWKKSSFNLNEQHNDSYIIKLKNSLNAGFGFSYYFS